MNIYEGYEYLMFKYFFSDRQTMNRVSTSSKQSEAGQEAQAQRMEELRAKLAACEQREKAALNKIQILGEYGTTLLLQA